MLFLVDDCRMWGFDLVGVVKCYGVNLVNRWVGMCQGSKLNTSEPVKGLPTRPRSRIENIPVKKNVCFYFC